MTTEINKDGAVFDIDNIITDLNGKADRDLRNLTAEGQAKINAHYVGEIISSLIPIDSPSVHLLDGALLQGTGKYEEFVTYMGNITEAAAKVPNVVMKGSPTNDNGVISNLGPSNNMAVPAAFMPGSSPWEIGLKIHTFGGEVTAAQTIIGEYDPGRSILLQMTSSGVLNMYVSSNGTSWDVVTGGASTVLTGDTDYWIKFAFTGSAYTLKISTDGETYTQIASTSSTTPFYQTTLNKRLYIGTTSRAGGASFAGSVDLNECYIDVAGSRWWEGMSPAWATNEAMFQSCVSQYGACGKFVYNKTNNTVRLPKISGILEGTTDVTALSDLVEAGLPEVAGKASYLLGRASSLVEESGAYSGTTLNSDVSWKGSSASLGTYDVNFRASNSNYIYGGSDKVQPQTIKVLYYIVVAVIEKNAVSVDGGSAIVDVDNLTITKNSDDAIQTVAVMDNSDGETPIKTWTGTRAEYEAIVTKDEATLYNITDDNIYSPNSSERMGQIVTSTIPLLDAGLHLLDGTLLQGNGTYKGFVNYMKGLYADSSYAGIFDTEANWQAAVTTYGVCGKFVYDSANNTLRLPKVSGFIEGTNDLSALAEMVEAGLPNITGTGGVGFDTAQGAAVGGAFYSVAIPGKIASNTSGTFLAYNTNMNASLCNSIYGNSTTVQPQSVKVLYYIVVANLTKTEISVDIDNIATDLNGKADTDLSNIVATSSTNFDGQWVESILDVAVNITDIGSYSYDLSSYLPNDNYSYEVWTRVYVNDDHASSTTNAWVAVGTVASPYSNSCIKLMAVTDTYADKTNVFGIIPIGTGRTIYMQIAERALASGANLRVMGYRRIGTNS